MKANAKTMKKNRFLRPALVSALGLAAGLALSPLAPAAAQDGTPFAPAQQQQIEELVHQYILAHPEVVVEALHRYEQQQQALEAQRQQEALAASAAALTADDADPVIGNPDGDVTLVEFFDYRCGYCKRMTGALNQLIEEDGNLRVVMKEFPILSRESVVGARAALAAERQGKYEAFHFALMENGGDLTEDEILAVADSVGLDTEQLLADMQDPAIEATLRRTHGLAETLGIGGTPAFVIGDTLIGGATSVENLRAKIAEARAKAS